MSARTRARAEAAERRRIAKRAARAEATMPVSWADMLVYRSLGWWNGLPGLGSGDDYLTSPLLPRRRWWHARTVARAGRACELILSFPSRDSSRWVNGSSHDRTLTRWTAILADEVRYASRRRKDLADAVAVTAALRDQVDDGYYTHVSRPGVMAVVGAVSRALEGQGDVVGFLLEDRDQTRQQIAARDAGSSTPMSGEDLRARREAMGLDLPALAKMLAVRPRTVRAWERGKVPGGVGADLDQIEQDPTGQAYAEQVTARAVLRYIDTALAAVAVDDRAVADVRADLLKVVTVADGHDVPAALRDKVGTVTTLVLDACRMLDRLSPPDLHTVTATATGYLPDALDAYKTGPADKDALLARQLDILADGLSQVVDRAAHSVAVDLGAQHAFLTDKYEGDQAAGIDAATARRPGTEG